MKRRSITGLVKTRRRKSATRKGGDAPKATRNRGASIAGEGKAVARLTRERDEALLRETANSEILRLISRSPGDLELVFQSILENAVRICDAKFGNLALLEGDGFRFVAQHGAPPKYRDLRQREPFIRRNARTNLGRVIKTKQVVHVADVAVEEPNSGIAALGGARTLVNVPMLKENELVGNIGIYRQEVRPFTDKQIELVQNFAAQAVIAIENARLLDELKQSLEQQTAAANVLGVISKSPGDLKPIFQAILENATRICEAKFGTLYLCEKEGFRTVATHNAPPAYIEARTRELIRPAPDTALGGVAATKRVVHIADIKTIPSYVERNPDSVTPVELGGYRTALAVPMLKNNELIGVITITRQDVRPFTGKQIELVQNFAAQAVIAIENARLLNELRQRTTDLGEALEQQTATAEVLRIISSSPGKLKPIFQAMLENAVRICEARFGTLATYENGMFREVALCNPPAEFARVRSTDSVFPPPPGGILLQIVETMRPVHIEDLTAKLSQAKNDEAARPLVELIELARARTMVAVPMLREDKLIGAIGIYRQQVRPFTDKQIALLQNFAAQAVIAIENARLLDELKQSLEQQTATADVLRVISSSPGELELVFQAMLENAVRICEAKFGVLYFCDEGRLRFGAAHDVPPAFAEARGKEPFTPAPDTGLGKVLATKRAVQIADLAATQTYSDRNPVIVASVEVGGVRTFASVPMLKDNDLIGVISIYRKEVRPFTDKQIDLLTNFAAQAVIAIENARLLDDLKKLNQQLEERVADQVGEIERMGRLRRFLPPQVADLIVASGTEKQLESHRREITALFCDLRGFTGFSESSDPEDVIALLRNYHAAIGQIIVKYSGTLERFAGDGVMVIFNDPVPVENPALQAVLMALDMRAAIGAMIEKWRDLGHDIGFGIGIAHGFATLGTIGFEGRFDYAAIGTVSNVASRLCDEAKPGQILISPRVRQAVDEAVTVEPVGEFALKGIRRPMTAYNVLAVSPSKPT